MIRQKSRCANCMANKSLLLKRGLKGNGIIFFLDFQYTIYNIDILFKVKKRYRKFWLKKGTTTNKVIRYKSICAICWSDKSRFLKQKPSKKLNEKRNKKTIRIILILNL